MAMIQTENTVIVEIGSAKKDDLEDLRYGEGKLFKAIAKAVEDLRESGQVGENVQPIVVIVKEKKDKD